MDHAERIPIDLGHEVAAASAASDPRTTVREDGTLVIDILAPQPCAPDPAAAEEIVVCAPVAEGGQPAEAASDSHERHSDGLSFRLGPVELGSISRGDGTMAFGMRMKF